MSASYSPDGHVVASTDDQSVRIWNADVSGEPLTLRGHSKAVSAYSLPWKKSWHNMVTLTRTVEALPRNYSSERLVYKCPKRIHEIT